MIKFPEMSHEEKLKHCMEYALGSLKLYTECPKGGTESYPNTWQEVKLANDMIDFLTEGLDSQRSFYKMTHRPDERINYDARVNWEFPPSK